MSVPRMRGLRPGAWALGVMACAWMALAPPAVATVFRILPVSLPDGYVIDGTITTDGAVGPLAASDITGWRISVTQTTTLVELSRSNSSAILDQVTARADGRLTVRTSPDGMTDGGLLQFGTYPRSITVADFTGYNATGGAVGYRLGRTGVMAGLNRPNHTLYTSAMRGIGARYAIPMQLIDGSAHDGLFLSGWIETNGHVGTLTSADLTDWDILVQQGWWDEFTERNSTLAAFLTGVSVSPDGTRMSVENPEGRFVLSKGMAGGHLLGVSLADFTAEQGRAGYYYGRLFTSELALALDATPYLIAAADGLDVPAPGGGALLVAAVILLAARRRRAALRPAANGQRGRGACPAA